MVSDGFHQQKKGYGYFEREVFPHPYLNLQLWHENKFCQKEQEDILQNTAPE